MNIALVTLSQEWRQWFHGIHLSELDILWGQPLLFWARFGKVAQFSGALTIILNIVPPATLRTYGNRLHSLVDLRALIRFWWTIVKGITSLLETERDSTGKEIESWKNGVVGFFGLLAIVVLNIKFVSYWWHKGWLAFAGGEILLFLGGCFVVALGLPLVGVLLASAAFLIGLLLDYLFIEPAAYVFEHPALERAANVFGLVALVVGFHFDLLTS